VLGGPTCLDGLRGLDGIIGESSAPLLLQIACRTGSPQGRSAAPLQARTRRNTGQRSRMRGAAQPHARPGEAGFAAVAQRPTLRAP